MPHMPDIALTTLDLWHRHRLHRGRCIAAGRPSTFPSEVSLTTWTTFLECHCRLQLPVHALCHIAVNNHKMLLNDKLRRHSLMENHKLRVYTHSPRSNVTLSSLAKVKQTWSCMQILALAMRTWVHMASAGCGIGSDAMHCWSSFGKNHYSVHTVQQTQYNTQYNTHIWPIKGTKWIYLNNNFEQFKWSRTTFCSNVRSQCTMTYH